MTLRFSRQWRWVLVLLAFLFLLVGGCKKDPSSSKESYCDRLSISSGQPAFNFECNSLSGTTHFTYDAYSRYATITLDFKCTDTGKSYNVYFHNIVRNSIGQATAYDATINGQKCHYP